MSQNLVTLTFNEAQLLAISQALSELELQLAALIAMGAAQRRRLKRMGDRSEAFCRQSINVLLQNPQVVPPSLKLAEAQADLLALDQLRPIMLRLQRLSERARDTEIALGSDVMDCALKGYKLLKVSGVNQGLEGLRKEMGALFAKSPRVAAVEEKSAAETEAA